MAIYNSVIRYKCDQCETEIDITPIASIGVITTVGLLAIGFWAFILVNGVEPLGWIALSLFGLVFLGLGYVTVVPALAHYLNPVVRSSPKIDLQIEQHGQNIVRNPIIWIERLGFLAGLLAPLIFIVIVLSVAAAIGYVNYTYFGN